MLFGVLIFQKYRVYYPVLQRDSASKIQFYNLNEQT